MNPSTRNEIDLELLVALPSFGSSRSAFLPLEPNRILLPSPHLTPNLPIKIISNAQVSTSNKDGHRRLLRLYYHRGRHGRMRPGITPARAPVLTLYSRHRGRQRHHQPSSCPQTPRGRPLALLRHRFQVLYRPAEASQQQASLCVRCQSTFGCYCYQRRYGSIDSV